MLSILFMPLADAGYLIYALWFYCYQNLNYLGFQSVDVSVPGEGYSRNASYALHLICTFLFMFYV